MTWRKGDPFDPDMRIDLTRLQRCVIAITLCTSALAKRIPPGWQ